MTDTARLGRSSAAFAMAAGLAAIFNTGLAWAKDASPHLLHFMDGIAGHNWTTQGLADLILFLGLGLFFRKTGWTEKRSSTHLISFLAVAVVAAGAGLFAWYALY
jgi:hypothetical protein